MLSLLVIAIAFSALYLHLQKNDQPILLKDLAVHISSVSSTAQKIQNHRFNNEKMAYAYVKSNFDDLNKSESKIRSEYQASKSLLDSLSYETRTPMNAIFGYTKLLKETELNTEQKDLITIIDNSYKNLDLTLSQMSNVSYSRPKLEKKEVPFNIVKEVETAVETFSIEADQKDILLGLYIDPLISHNLLGDGEKLSQVLTHLIDNALEMSDVYKTIDIKLENINTDDDKTHIKFSILDQGRGLNDIELDSIRKIFSDMEIVEESSIIGLGIKNLTMSNRTIQRMGGSLEVKSKINKGSTFSFKLSFKKDNEEIDRKENPIFKGLKIGLALPHKDIERQVDNNLQTYVEYLGGDFVIYSYDEITDAKNIDLPDVMFAYHAYTKNQGELDTFANLKSKIILITSGTLRSQIDFEKHFFSSIVYAPITMSKILRVLLENKDNSSPEIKTNISEDIHVLVVEDNIISQTIIANILKNMNISVTVASNGKEAYILRKENTYSIIFMDISMPIMNGFEATDKILTYEKKNNDEHVPIIAFSADALESDKIRYLEAGMDDLIGKPVHAEEIQNILQEYCLYRNCA
jgi:signal transduction histidine kinase/ActR/RegA family two-component response regulator